MNVPAAPRPASVTRRRFLGLAATALAGAGGIAAITAGGSAHDDHDDDAPDGTPAGTPSASPVADALTFTLTSVDLKFEPKDLRIPANTDVTIVFTNDGVMPHDVVVPSLGINSGRLDSGASIDVPVNAPAGSHMFYCSVPGHKQAGMVGAIVAE